MVRGLLRWTVPFAAPLAASYASPSPTPPPTTGGEAASPTDAYEAQCAGLATIEWLGPGCAIGTCQTSTALDARLLGGAPEVDLTDAYAYGPETNAEGSRVVGPLLVELGDGAWLVVPRAAPSRLIADCEVARFACEVQPFDVSCGVGLRCSDGTSLGLVEHGRWRAGASECTEGT